MNGAPKHELNVASGSSSPTSVPASFAVNPWTKWYITSSPSRIETGGRTPKASAVSSTMVAGCPPRDPSATFGLQARGYEKRVFSVMETSRRSRSWGSVSSNARPREGGHVLDDRPRHRQRGGDDRLRLLVEVDELRVAPVLEVRESLLGPARFVVADEAPVRIGGEGGLAGPGEAEHDRRVAARADVARAVHREVPGVREQEVHHREDRLLHDSAVVGSSDDEADPVPEVDDHRAVGPGTVTLGLTAERLGVEHRPTLRLRVDEARHVPRKHVAGEERMRRVLPDEAIGDRVRGVHPHAAVLNIEGRAGRVEVARYARKERLEVVRIEGLEAVLPPDPMLDLGPGDGEGVLHRAAPCRSGRCERRAAPGPPAGSRRPCARRPLHQPVPGHGRSRSLRERAGTGKARGDNGPPRGRAKPGAPGGHPW